MLNIYLKMAIFGPLQFYLINRLLLHCYLLIDFLFLLFNVRPLKGAQIAFAERDHSFYRKQILDPAIVNYRL